jgi:hypothetical protein
MERYAEKFERHFKFEFKKKSKTYSIKKRDGNDRCPMLDLNFFRQLTNDGLGCFVWR